MFAHLIQFGVVHVLDLGLLDEGANVTLGLSRSSRLWTLFLRGSGEHPVDTSGDLRRESRSKQQRKVFNKLEELQGYMATVTKKSACYFFKHRSPFKTLTM